MRSAWAPGPPAGLGGEPLLVCARCNGLDADLGAAASWTAAAPCRFAERRRTYGTSGRLCSPRTHLGLPRKRWRTTAVQDLAEFGYGSPDLSVTPAHSQKLST